MKNLLSVLVVSLILFSCASQKTQNTVRISRPGLTYEATGKQATPDQVVNSVVDGKTVDYTNGVAPAIAEQVKKNPKATVSISSKGDITYIGDSGYGGVMRGIWENYFNVPIEVIIKKAGAEEQLMKLSIAPGEYARLALSPGKYESQIIWNKDTEPVKELWEVDTISGNAYSPKAKEWVDFLRYTK
jgi:hypothetical protein